MVVTKGICPAISYCLDQVWHIGYEVDVSLLSCVRIGDLVDNVGILCVHLKKTCGLRMPCPRSMR